MFQITELSDRMKAYEGSESDRQFLRIFPVVARLDGRGFSKFTKGMARPYDRRLSMLMIETVRHLVKETVANCGYTQSDEITLTWGPPEENKQIFFDGRVQKMTSQLAAMATGYFNDQFAAFFDPHDFPRPSIATFDARTWQVPTPDEGADAFRWREHDARRNSISMAAQHYYTQRELNNKSTREMLKMLIDKGTDWSEYPLFFRQGTYVQRKTVQYSYSEEEVASLPDRHEARRNPGGVYERSWYPVVDIPWLDVVSNRPGVIYSGETPCVSVDDFGALEPPVVSGAADLPFV